MNKKTHKRKERKKKSLQYNIGKTKISSVTPSGPQRNRHISNTDGLLKMQSGLYLNPIKSASQLPFNIDHCNHMTTDQFTLHPPPDAARGKQTVGSFRVKEIYRANQSLAEISKSTKKKTKKKQSVSLGSPPRGEIKCRHGTEVEVKRKNGNGERKKISLCSLVCCLIVSIVTAPDWLD